MRSWFAALLCATAPAWAGFSRTSLDFGLVTLGMPPPTFAFLTFRNDLSVTVTVNAVTPSDANYFVGTDCPGKTLAPGQTCIVDIFFSPQPSVGELGSRVSFSGSVVVRHSAGSETVLLAGTAERSLAHQYYRWLVRRFPTDAEAAFWLGEARRARDLGANPSDAWRVLAQALLSSAEFASTGYIGAAGTFEAALHSGLMSRPIFSSDAAGADYWRQQLAAGMPRESVGTWFLFFPEWSEAVARILAPTSVRPEIDLVLSLYRILGRVPEAAGYDFWLRRLRIAQCQGTAALAAEIADATQFFVATVEYSRRNRTNAQFVTDLYSGLLRRGADSQGAQYWIGRLDAVSRAAVVDGFVHTPEVGAMAAGVAAAGCATP